MAFTSTHRFARISPQKARLVVDQIRGLGVDEAKTTLQFSKKRAAVFIHKTLLAAEAAAEESEDTDVRSLVVTEARVDEGPTIKRFQPKDRGRAHPIKKRTCHIIVAVDEVAPKAEPASAGVSDEPATRPTTRPATEPEIETPTDTDTETAETKD